VGDFRIAEPFFQAFFFEDINFIHRYSPTRSVGFDSLRLPPLEIASSETSLTG
jgi:hypothetical protein